MHREGRLERPGGIPTSAGALDAHTHPPAFSDMHRSAFTHSPRTREQQACTLHTWAGGDLTWKPPRHEKMAPEPRRRLPGLEETATVKVRNQRVKREQAAKTEKRVPLTKADADTGSSFFFWQGGFLQWKGCHRQSLVHVRKAREGELRGWFALNQSAKILEK